MGAIGPFSTSSVHRAFIRAAARIGIHGARPYDLRHTYGTALYRVAGDTRLVKDVLATPTTRMTERYTLRHVPEAMRLATSRFEEHLAQPRRRHDEPGRRRTTNIAPIPQDDPMKTPRPPGLVGTSIPASPPAAWPSLRPTIPWTAAYPSIPLPQPPIAADRQHQGPFHNAPRSAPHPSSPPLRSPCSPYCTPVCCNPTAATPLALRHAPHASRN